VGFVGRLCQTPVPAFHRNALQFLSEVDLSAQVEIPKAGSRMLVENR
jgi:hypothetical protein